MTSLPNNSPNPPPLAFIDLPGRNPDRRLLSGRRLQDRNPPAAKDEQAPLVSVITPCLNAAAHLDETLDAVAAQTYPRIEHIVVDGGSTDATLALLAKRAETLELVVSEPDRGIADAFNKGIALARGEVIGISNADDAYTPDAAARAVAALASPEGRECGYVFGACEYRKESGGSVILPAAPDYARRLPFFMPGIHHPTVFVRRETYARVGLFRTDYRFAMDYEWLYRAHRMGIKGLALPGAPLAVMRMAGASNRFYKDVRREVRRASMLHGTPALVAWTVWALLMTKHALWSKDKWR